MDALYYIIGGCWVLLVGITVIHVLAAGVGPQERNPADPNFQESNDD